ncbi:hypothetical protein [Rhodococcus chondri]|uniref:Anti sigma-E protein RseA N-terminal domain-containing protein n=1 Tax=Rhodococcus chondri TaxID=3065941 RepID=A0ABU7JNX1_9NOCA|nr:hypothetical protein [Rhodococcus sp. CC-R104]MEE2031731.1 hypothetical protein [Rhodococcus sp. CC-R104]
MNEDELLRPPYSADLLADLHAGALDDDLADRLWPRVRRDPDAMAVIASLDAVQSRLRSLGDAAPTTPIPPEVAARIDTALAAQGEQRQRRRRLLTVAGIGAAAALAVIFTLVLRGVAQGDEGPGTVPLAAPTSESSDDALAPRAGGAARSGRHDRTRAAHGAEAVGGMLDSQRIRFHRSGSRLSIDPLRGAGRSDPAAARAATSAADGTRGRERLRRRRSRDLASGNDRVT